MTPAAVALRLVLAVCAGVVVALTLEACGLSHGFVAGRWVGAASSSVTLVLVLDTLRRR